MPKKLSYPDDVRNFLARRFNNQHQNWLTGEGSWPLCVPLGVPTEKDVTENPVMVRSWVDAWSCWRGVGELLWEDRQWPRLGKQRLPANLLLSSAQQVAEAVQQGSHWKLATQRYERFVCRWPVLAGAPALARNFDVLAEYSQQDFECLFALLDWFDENPSSGMYLRQLPVVGLDTKWVEKRRGLVMDLLQAIRGTHDEREFYSLCGLRKPPYRLRVRLLCPTLRAAVGGLRDIEGPVEELSTLAIEPKVAVIVENLETGVALPDMEGCVALMKLGNAVSVLDTMPWLHGVPAVYWGDIDTHGFAILDRARAALPHLISVLMNESTLLAHQALWGQEPVQHPNTTLLLLTTEERMVYQGLREQRWGQKIRLEQERITWTEALNALAEAVRLLSHSSKT